MSQILEPSPEVALQFAVMLSCGMPPRDAIPYFHPTASPDDLQSILKLWLKAESVQKAILKVQGKLWQEMPLNERIQYAIDKHYSEMAYYLYSRNYSELQGAEKAKADTCRQTLEAKLAGMAGKLDALSQFYADLASGKIKTKEAS